jgi:glycosyltransferase involved in cell wall biosynthesis
VEYVVRAAHVIVHEMRRDDVSFALLGFGDTLERLRRLSTELELDDVLTFTGRVGPPAISSYLSTASLGMCPDPKTSFNDASTMNKVLEYMAHAIPVVGFDLEETQATAGAAAHYVSFNGDNAANIRAFAEAIVAMLDYPARAQAMGRQGRAQIEAELNWPTQAARYVEAYDRLLGRLSEPAHDELPIAA